MQISPSGGKGEKNLDEMLTNFDAKKTDHIKCRLAEEKLQQMNSARHAYLTRLQTKTTVCGAVERQRQADSTTLFRF